MFKLSKIYFDLVTEDGTVVIAYVTDVRALGARLAPAGVERYSPDGQRFVRTGRASLSLASEPDVDSLSCVDFDFGDARYRLEVAPQLGGFAPPHSSQLGFRWSCKLARYSGQLRRLDRAEPVLSGDGYADFVELTGLPRALGMRRLQWGRVHLPEQTLVYTELERASGPAFAGASLWAARERQPLGELCITYDGTGQRTTLVDPGGRVFLSLTPERVLHSGTATDRRRFPSAVEQLFYRLVGGAMREQRWVSRATCGAGSGQVGWAVHELVEFGRGVGR